MWSGELQALVDDLAGELCAPVLVEDDELRMVAYSSHDKPVDDIRRDSILSRQAPPAAAGWFREYGLDRADSPVRIPSDPAKGILGRLCVPVRHRGYLCGYLWLIDDDAMLPGTQISLAMKTAEQAGPLMFGHLLVERIAGSALSSLLSPSDIRRAEGERYFDDAGHLAPPGDLVVIVVQPAQTPHGRGAAIAESLRDITRRWPSGQVVGRASADHGVLVTRDWPDTAAGTALAGEVRRDLLLRLRRAEPDPSVVVGIGDPVTILADAYRSYRQAKLAARVAARVPGAGPVARWHDLGAFRTLAGLSGGESAPAAIDPRLFRLLDHADTTLIVTLETYLDLAGDMKACAEQLHLHRGSVYYRLQKAAEIAGISLRSGHDRLAVHLGLKLARLAGLFPGPVPPAPTTPAPASWATAAPPAAPTTPAPPAVS